jgi:L-ascorbate metabolism protein UlaG (beta-lactamase superfamily)
VKTTELYKKLQITDQGTGEHIVKITWLGTSGAYISDRNTGIVIDPFVSKYGLSRILLGLPMKIENRLVDKMVSIFDRKIEAVIVSHSHYDHSMDAPYVAKKTGSLLIGSESTMNIGRGAGLREKMMKMVRGGDTMKLGSSTIRFIESRHGGVFFGRVPYPGTIDDPLVPPVRAPRYRVGTVFGIHISHPRGSILHHGSAGFVPGMYDDIHADILLMGISGREDTREYLDRVAMTCGAPLLAPVHFDNLFSPFEAGFKPFPAARLKQFYRDCMSYHSHFKVRTLPLGKQIALLPIKDII